MRYFIEPAVWNSRALIETNDDITKHRWLRGCGNLFRNKGIWHPTSNDDKECLLGIDWIEISKKEAFMELL